MSLQRILGVWLLMMVGMIANGVFRVAVLAPMLSDRPANVLSAALGITIILAITRPFVRRIQPPWFNTLLGVGLAWAGMSVAFEFLFGHYALGMSWADLLVNYNVLRGRPWPFVLLAIGVAPLVWARDPSSFELTGAESNSKSKPVR